MRPGEATSSRIRLRGACENVLRVQPRMKKHGGACQERGAAVRGSSREKSEGRLIITVHNKVELI